MKGLSPEQRHLLARIAAPEMEILSHDEDRILRTLEPRGVVRAVPHPRGREWVATDLGHLALRVCPISP